MATGDYVLALDDDCYLPPDGLRRAVAGAREHEADLVSFAVLASTSPTHRFDRPTAPACSRSGAAPCSSGARRLERTGYFDPEIFVWANEVEFMLRFFDAGFRHLHLPEVVAVHMKDASQLWEGSSRTPGYRMNNRNLAYTAAKHLHARQAPALLMALTSFHLRDALRGHPWRREGGPHIAARIRPRPAPSRPVHSQEISRYLPAALPETFASPWWLSRPPLLFLVSIPAAVVRRLTGRRRPARHPGRSHEYYYDRGARYYPTEAATLEARLGEG